MIKTPILVGLAAAGALLAACGSSGSSKPSAAAPAPPPPTAATSPAPAPAAAAGASVSVKAATSPLGQILVGPDGRTLYAFTNDTEAKSTCSGTCAEAWPPAVVAANWTVAPGLDSGIFSTVARDDGTEQLTAGQFPLYFFSGDARPGDVNGQGSGNVWFVVDTKAQVVKDAAAGAAAAAPTTAAAPVAPAPAASLADSSLGKIVVDGSGRTLYAFTKDADGTSTCLDACANAWPPAIVTGDVAVQGLDQSLFTTVPRPDGSMQLKMGKWPLYTFSGDAAPGDVNGQGSGGSWFVVGQDGKLIK
jgi:predicted lipoprotein with Yx(FWY)xxD motif